MKKSDSYKTLEERVGSAYENVKVNIWGNSKKLDIVDVDIVRSSVLFLGAVM